MTMLGEDINHWVTHCYVGCRIILANDEQHLIISGLALLVTDFLYICFGCEQKKKTELHIGTRFDLLLLLNIFYCIIYVFMYIHKLPHLKVVLWKLVSIHSFPKEFL